MSKRTPTKVLVCGGRTWSDVYPIIRELGALVREHPTLKYCIHGDAPGADTLVDGIADMFGLKIRPVPAHWKHTRDCVPDCKEVVGKAAGPIRNKKMLDMHTDIVLAFHKDFDNSRGTRHMVALARVAHIKTRVFDK